MAFELFGGIFEGGGGGVMSMVSIAFWVGLILVPTIGMIILIFWLVRKKLTWNLDIEIKLPRSGGRLINAEWAKGSYNTKKGVVFIKRKRKRKIEMKPFKINKYLQGNRILTVVQKGSKEYVPVLNHSWIEMQEDKPLRDENGKLIRGDDRKPIYEKAALITTRADMSEDIAWKNYCEREGKAAYSVVSLLREYLPFIGTALILVFNFVGFAILWSKVS